MLVLIIAALMVAAFSPGYARPRPTPTPGAYPPPPDFEAQAYPAPPTPLAPTAVPSLTDQLYSNVPAADPRPGIPYAWGEFTVYHYDFQLQRNVALRAEWVSIQGVGRQYYLEGFITIESNLDSRTAPLSFYDYDAGNDLNLYFSHVTMCDMRFWVQHVILDDIVGDIRQPNDYFNKCLYLPNLRRDG
jgi:hypothetical protein